VLALSFTGFGPFSDSPQSDASLSPFDLGQSATTSHDAEYLLTRNVAIVRGGVVLAPGDLSRGEQ